MEQNKYQSKFSGQTIDEQIKYVKNSLPKVIDELVAGNIVTRDIANDAKTTSDEAKGIALGRAVGYVFDTKPDMDLWLNDINNVALLKLGDNLYIRAKDVPDYWWDGQSVQELETQKVDLDGVYTKSESDAKYRAKEDNSFNEITADKIVSSEVILGDEFPAVSEEWVAIKMNSYRLLDNYQFNYIEANKYIYNARSLNPIASFTNTPPPQLYENTIYTLGLQTNITLDLPAISYGNEYDAMGRYIQVDFVSGDSPTTLTITSSGGVSECDLVPEANTTYSIFFDWGLLDYDSDVSRNVYGWRISYAEYTLSEV